MSDRMIVGSRASDSATGKIFDAVAIGAADVQVIIPADTIDLASIHLHVDPGGNAVAAVKVFVSNSYRPNGGNSQDESIAIVPGNWVEITSECVGIVAITGASTQDQMVIPMRTNGVGMLGVVWLKIVVVHTSGAGVLSGWWHGRAR